MESDLSSSFHAACFRLGLLKGDNQYHLTMQEAAVNNSAATLCSLFVVIMTWCEPSNPLDVYEHHKESQGIHGEDLVHQQRTQFDLSFNDDIFNLALNDSQDRVLSMEGRELSEYDLPHPQTVDDDRFARVYRREIDHDQAEQQAFVEQDVPLLTADQRRVYDWSCFMVYDDEGGMLFFDTPGGTGKAF